MTAIRSTSRAVRGPGAIRRHAKSAVSPAHTAPAPHAATAGARPAPRDAAPRAPDLVRVAAAAAARSTAARPAAVVRACSRSRPRPPPMPARHEGPCRRRMSASSALPRWKRTLAQNPSSRTGCSVTRSPLTSRCPARATRSARSASSRYARGNRSSNPPTASSTALR
ncbi:hypothetical protein ACFQQB_70860 [Nonomuraea rubra]|uniref:hypothetical protein n=1 Tax=Nonomuraea rubra TaxID=46180 RepID=UPI00360D6E8D